MHSQFPNIGQVNHTTQPLQYQGSDFKTATGGALAGMCVYGGAKSLTSLLCPPLKKFGQDFELKYKNEYTPITVLKAMRNEGISKSVTVRNFSLRDAKQIAESRAKIYWQKGAFLKRILKKLGYLNNVEDNIYNRHALYAKGSKAAFIPGYKIIALNFNKRAGVFFHEAGHVSNYFKKGIGKFIIKLRLSKLLKYYSLAVFASALFKRKKGEGEKTNSIFDKITTFVKENCGKLALIGTVPLLLEEGLASIKGIKMAKKVVSPKAVKSLKKAYLLYWMTYAAGAVTTALGVKLASVTRDKIAPPVKKEPKQT